METWENLSEMEATEVPEDPSITLARKISSATRQTRRFKSKAAKEEKLKKRLAADGPGGGLRVLVVVVMADVAKRACS